MSLFSRRGQPPGPACSPCPWDCDDGDGTIGIADFLAVLAQWGSPGSCDLDGGGTVGIKDFLVLIAAWGPNPRHPADFDGDCSVGILDLLILLGNWG